MLISIAEVINAESILTLHQVKQDCYMRQFFRLCKLMNPQTTKAFCFFQTNRAPQCDGVGKGALEETWRGVWLIIYPSLR